jgi:hypothetical protein
MGDREWIRVRMVGGPLDGHDIPWPSPPPQRYNIPTWNGVWIGELKGPLPDDLSTGDYASHEYQLSGDGPKNYRYDFVGTRRAD